MHQKEGTCDQPPISEQELSANIEEILSEIHSPEAVHEFITAWVHQENEKKHEGVNADHEANKNALIANQNKLNGLIDLRVSGLISDEEFIEKRSVIDVEKKRLEKLVANAEQNKSDWLNIADRMFIFSELAVNRFKDASAVIQRGCFKV